ncbi:hypothetical protein HXX76_001984 [Chlamydomonas incerta]|uniref:Uncharacterized protein n=1 Tax=Chlamydomonas incerta TaxID=51695 RepID=A0A836B0E5_CHLIN|nr:hypothetical protein HXX76_001984 [Chlamydomonas incerta]|eukprot:KAG2443634.1 hypothetical protein HXX76_001984 [Chlamydomonas incerta]
MAHVHARVPVRPHDAACGVRVLPPRRYGTTRLVLDGACAGKGFEAAVARAVQCSAWRTGPSAGCHRAADAGAPAQWKRCAPWPGMAGA